MLTMNVKNYDIISDFKYLPRKYIKQMLLLQGWMYVNVMYLD